MIVGKNVHRKEGVAKVTGAARYVDDLVFADMIFGVTVRSTVPRGKITAVRFAPHIPWHEFTIVTAKDVPGKNHVALITYDQPFLADTVINHPEEPVLLLAHPDKHVLEAARRAVTIEVEPLPAVLTVEDALAKKTIVWGEDNVFKEYTVQKGDVAAAFSRPDVIVTEGTYATGAQEQLYIENNGMIATWSDDEGVTVWGSMQCPYYVHKALLPLFGLEEDKVRVIQTETGGGFGGKEEYPSLVAGHAALLAKKAKRPVKIVYDRAEDMVATTKRHPSQTRVKTAVTKDGDIVGLDIEFVIDGGAYNTLSPVVLSRGTIHAAGPYHTENVRVHSRAVATNTPPQGAFRGFGAPQSIFAMERHLDVVARQLHLDPAALRKRNFVKTGETTATSQVIREPVDLAGILDRALVKADYFEKQQRYAAQNPSSVVKRGVGFATFMHGAGFTGSGEKSLASVVGVEALPNGHVRVLAASTEIGQGTNTVFSQIVSDTLGLPYEMVDVLPPDTRFVPNSGPTVASRTCMVVGKLVHSAAVGLEQTLTGAGLFTKGAGAEAWQKACAAYIERHGALKCYSQYKQPPNVEWDDKLYRGEAYATYAWATYVADVSVDMATYEVRVEDFVAVQEVGRVVHPILAAGQIEGGVAQGIGYAIYEKVVWKDGRMANGQMTNYIMPTSVDAPPIRVFFEETPSEHGPFGAKGIGELPMDGPAPAILNAIAAATALSPTAIPLLPEDMMKLVRA
jgi:CO/xanthine dehydrogenase Mo-binding subunit